tara:strand:- start:24708 stop:27092 length:2385 start_codon:yes stop_codon:yes gene_type:complete
MRIIQSIAGVIAALLALPAGLVVLVGVIIVLIFATAQTDTGGEAQLTGLDGPVTILRDAHAVPHIFADSKLDAYRALGFAHAQDRFFQMELTRRTAAGRLSEVIGPLGLRGDRFMRTLGIYRLAEASVATLSPEARAVVEAYAQGVNAWLTSPDTRRPAELIVLGIDPEPWRPADSAAWVRLMAILLAGDWRTEILKAQLSGRLSAEQIRDLWPDEPDDSPTTLAMSSATRAQLANLAAAIPDFFPAASASNEWVVAGSRSRSGKPLLANDPHLGLNAPGMWHLARIETPDFAASGAALPGQPFFMVGQNSHLAWGLTTTHADTQDLFIERLNPDDPNQYLTPDGSLPFETRVETIRVRGRATPERLTVRTTRHGPVISDISPGSRTIAAADTVVSLAFAALREDDATADAVHGINTARTVPDFLAALRGFHAPMQNVAYAHRDGTFGFVSAGRLPIRPGGPGNRPQPGWTGEHDWAGFVPFGDLPQSQNPESGLVVNANNRVAARDYPHTIANDWPEGFRAQRILDLLAETPVHTSDSFAAIQNDVVSLGAQSLAQAMFDSLRSDDATTPAVAALNQWNGAMSADRREPLVYAAWSKALRARLIDDELGELAEAYRGVPVRALTDMLTQRHGWCDDIRTPNAEGCETIAVNALLTALDEIGNKHGSDRQKWRWGDAHRAAFEHILLRFAGPFSGLFSPRVETSGGNHTINRGTYASPGNGSFPHVHGPGLRAIFDMASPGEARFMIAPGQSGHIASPYYGDLAPAWRDGRYIVLNGTRDEVRRTATSELSLTP